MIIFTDGSHAIACCCGGGADDLQVQRAYVKRRKIVCAYLLHKLRFAGMETRLRRVMSGAAGRSMTGDLCPLKKNGGANV
ncbi:hypothetical protein NL676_015336 [Syzygium grande]|nr:hypothetical protein NL676_015336 [Syzygium grande]